MSEGKRVAVIPPKLVVENKKKTTKKQLKVAAYCRVSTESEEQEGSYEAQIEYYKKKIMEKPEWCLAGIYADDGKSGTNTKKRDDFNALIRKCMKGKIDLVLTKSVSRFARNTVDSLSTIRKLREKNIAVYFEKENINTLDSTGELLITIMSSLAQEESRNISENVKWGVIRRFEKGKVLVNEKKFMGYAKDEEKNLVIVEEEARIVKKIFRLYMEGMSTYKIARQLETEGIKTVTGKSKWYPSVIEQMLGNEKYMGDALLQKTITVDYLTKKRAKNNGQVKQYYVENNHEAIIPKDLFYRVQAERVERASRYRTTKKGLEIKERFSSSYALTELLKCGYCGDVYRRITWYDKNKKKTIVWRCNNRRWNGKESCPESPSLNERALQEAIMEAVNGIVADKNQYLEAFRQNVVTVISGYKEEEEVIEYDRKIQELNELMMQTVERNAREENTSIMYEKEYKEISEKIRTLEQERDRKKRIRDSIQSKEERVKEIETYINSKAGMIRKYDDCLIRKLIASIKVVAKDKIVIQFKTGIIIEQEIKYEK